MGVNGHDVDVAVLGYGPVGQALAALLGRSGHRMAVFERFGEIYRLPRAVHLDPRDHARSAVSPRRRRVGRRAPAASATTTGMAPGPLAGRLAIQGCVAGTSGDGLLDDVTAGGFTLLATHGDPNDHLDEEQRELLQTLGGRVVSLDSRSDCGVRDLDGRLTAWLEEHEAHAVLVRPDFYVFGSAASPADLSALVDDLRAQLPSPAPACTAT